jgi:hypothetical protein
MKGPAMKDLGYIKRLATEGPGYIKRPATEGPATKQCEQGHFVTRNVRSVFLCDKISEPLMFMENPPK